jgi:hypothetical protein
VKDSSIRDVVAYDGMMPLTTGFPSFAGAMKRISVPFSRESGGGDEKERSEEMWIHRASVTQIDWMFVSALGSFTMPTHILWRRNRIVRAMQLDPAPPYEALIGKLNTRASIFIIRRGRFDSPFQVIG